MSHDAAQVRRPDTVHGSLFRTLCSVCLALSFSLFYSCAREPALTGLSVTENATRFEIEVNGRRRGGAMHVPPLYDGTRPYSLVFVLHGASGTGASMRKTASFDAMAEDLEFIMVYPDGKNRRWESPDDTAFFDSMIAEFQKKYSIDSARIYAAGHSAGAIKAYQLAACLPGKFAAIAPVAGCVFSDAPRDDLEPVSVLHIHSRNDEDVPFDGVGEWNMLSAQDSVEFWKRVNGVSDGPVVFYDAHGIEGTVWKGERCDTASLFYPAAGHQWPRLASDMIADFFYNHPPRPSRIRMRSESLPVAFGFGSAVELECELENAESVDKVSYFSNGSLVGSVESKPWAFQWTPAVRGVHRLSAKAYLNDGSAASSTLNPFVLITAPASGGAAAGGNSSMIPAAGAVSTKAEEEQYEARYAVDGDFFTRWSSGWTDDQSLTVDLGSVHTVSGATLVWETAYAKRYAIEVSADGESWSLAFEKNGGEGGIESVEFSPAPARYLRMRGMARSSEWGYSLWELFVHGE